MTVKFKKKNRLSNRFSIHQYITEGILKAYYINNHNEVDTFETAMFQCGLGLLNMTHNEKHFDEVVNQIKNSYKELNY